MSPKFSHFEASLEHMFTATHTLINAVDRNGRGPHEHIWRVRVGWTHECSLYSGGFTWDADEVKQKVVEACQQYEGADLNTLFLFPTAEVLAADLLDRLPVYYEWVEVSHRLDYRTRISRKHLSPEWLEHFRIGKPTTVVIGQI